MRRPHSPRAPLLAAAKTQEVVLFFKRYPGRRSAREPSGFLLAPATYRGLALLFLSGAQEEGV